MADYGSLGSILDPTSGLTNPLAFAKDLQGFQANALNLQKLRSEQAAGEAYQASINPQTGELDPNEFRRQLAARPGAAMAAGPNLQNIQGISSNQLNMQHIKLGWYNGALGALPDNASKEQILSTIRNGVAHGMFSPEDAAREASQVPDDDAGRAAWIQQHRLTAADAMDKFHVQNGTWQTINTPQGTYTIPMPVAPGRGAPTIYTPHGPAPGDIKEISVPMDDQGLIPQDANGVPSRTPKTWARVPVPTASLPGVQRGGPPTTIPGPGGSGAAPPVPPAPTSPPLPGAYQGRPGSKGATPPPPAQPAAALPTAPPPTQPPAVPFARTEPPQGQPEKLKADVAAYTSDQAMQPDVQTRAQNLGHAYVALQALQSATGKGAQGINDLRSFAQTLGILPPGAVNEQKLFEIIHKYTERAMIDAAGGASTDLGKRMQEQANAGTLLSTPTNVEILRNDMGKALQSIAAYKAAPDKTGAGYLDHRANLSDTTDPRGFVWDLYSGPEKARINAEVEKDGKTSTAATKLHRAIGMSQRLNLQIPGLTAAP